MSTRTPRRSTRSQSRELSVLNSEDDSVSIASASSLKTNGNVKQRKARASTRKGKKPETIVEDEQVLIIDSIAAEDSSSAIEETEREKDSEEEHEVAEEIDQTQTTNSYTSSIQSTAKTNKLRQKLIQSLEHLVRFLPLLPPLLVAASALFGVLLLSPNKPFARKVYVDENALQPGTATVEWGWSQVELADQAADRIALVADSSSEVRAALLTRELQVIGLTAHNQSYRFDVPSLAGSSVVSGINTYARFPAARGDGREAFVIAASWKSAWDGMNDPDVKEDNMGKFKLEGSKSPYEKGQVRRTNVRGIASAIILARHLSGYAHWSKDLIFVFSDGEIEGMQAWTSTYFGRDQSNLKAEKLHCGGSAIWNALAIDYPSDSFSHIVVKHEGLQGQLPNMDVINTFTRIAQKTGGIPVSLAGASEHDPTWGSEPLGKVGRMLEEHLWKEEDGTKKYLSGLLNVAKQIGYLSSGQPSGIHGLFHRYHVDAITLFLHPAPGPYGFHHIGRAVESMTRSMSNLLERLHHSQFFYLLTSPYRFIEVAKYLPVALLLSAALTITGICIWIDEGKRSYLRKSALVLLLRAAIEEEALKEDAVIAGNGGVITAANDVPLTNPTTAQLLSTFLSLLVDRSLQRGDLLGSAKLRSSTAFMQVLGRPIASAVGVVLSCHAIGGYAYYIITRSPIDCAVNGLERCKSIQLIASVSTLCTLLLIWRVRRASSRLLYQRLSQCQSQLPEIVVPFLLSSFGFRVRAIARTVHTIALLEVGMLVLTISLVNFSLALVIGSILCIPLCAARLPPSMTMAEEDMYATPSKERFELERSVSPASNDTDLVETLTLSLPSNQKLPFRTKLRLLLQSAIFFFLAPFSLVYIIKGASKLGCHYYYPDYCPFTTSLDLLFYNTILQHHILGTLAVSFITLIYLPIVLVAFVANSLAALG